MINADTKIMMRMMTEQFFQLGSFSKEPRAFSSQPEVNPKVHSSSSSGANPSETMKAVMTIISLQSGREIDNQVRNLNKSCIYPHRFFQNSSPFSSSLETGSSNNPRECY